MTAERELAGCTLAGRYDLLALLGAGGMGAVYRAHDRELDELVALKVISAELAADPAMVDRFRQEVKLARRVTHINIARTFELGRADEILYCTMELVDGESLRSRLRRETKLSIAEATRIAAELCDGLAAAHAADVVHRDIKPDNVLLSRDGRVVLADFGVAAITAGHSPGDLSGTPEYMAPEQALGEPPTPATDIYAVGVVLFEMLTGMHAFTGTVVEILAAKLDVERLGVPHGSMPVELGHVIGRATARERGDRIASASELGRMLAPWTGAVPVQAATPRRTAEAADLQTVVVVPPRGDEPRMHLAEGVHEELLRRLVRRPRLRVLPRGATTVVAVPGATVVELHAGELLAATIRRDRRQTTLHLPLDVASIALTADAIASAVAEAVAHDREADPASQALEMLLRARTLAHRGFTSVPPALQLLEHAHALCPEDPRIAATLAMLCVRFVIVGPDDQGDFARARSLVRAALASAPELSESHVAAAHLELHTGDPAVAAAHFRTAIACSPYVAEAHEGLGRMLLESGFLDVALARLDDALAISPNLSTVRWEIARAHALEQNWPVVDRLVGELVRYNDRPIARVRFAWWRGNVPEVASYRDALGSVQGFEPELMRMLYAVIVERAWPAYRDDLLGYAYGSTSPSLRRRGLIAQLGAEAAGYGRDVPACVAMIEHAVAHGLFDLHWLDRCPLLEGARQTAEVAGARAKVKRRADAILDALYGDADVAVLTDTIAVA